MDSKVSFPTPFFFFSITILIFAFLVGHATCEEVGSPPPAEPHSPPKSNNTECLSGDIRGLFRCFIALNGFTMNEEDAAGCCKAMRTLVEQDRQACICRFLSFRFVRAPPMRILQIFSTCGLTVDSISACY